MQQIVDAGEVTRLFHLYMRDEDRTPSGAWHGKFLADGFAYIITGDAAGGIRISRARSHYEAMSEFRRLDAKVQRLLDMKNAISARH